MVVLGSVDLLKWGPVTRIHIAGQSISELCAVLIDTGAGDNFIDPTVAKRLELAVVEECVRVEGLGGEFCGDRYTARVCLPDFGLTYRGDFIGGGFGKEPLVILGRPFLRDHRLFYDGRTGQVTIEQ